MIKVVKIFLMLCFFFYLFTHYDFFQIWVKLKDINVSDVLLAFLIAIFCTSLQSVRWAVFLRANKNIDVIIVLKAYFRSMYADIFVPGKLGSDALRVKYLSSYDSYANLITSLVVLRLQGVFILSILSGVFYFLYGVSTVELRIEYVFIFVFLLALSLFLIFFVVYRFFYSFYIKVEDVIFKVRSFYDFKTFFLSSVVYLFFYSSSVLVFYFSAQSISLDIDFWLLYISAPLILLVSILPITFMGRGSTEFITVALLANHDTSGESLILMNFVVFLIFLLINIFSAFNFFLRR